MTDANEVILYGPDPRIPGRNRGGVASHIRYLEEALSGCGTDFVVLSTDWDLAESLPAPALVQRGLGVGRASLIIMTRRWPSDAVVHVNSSLYRKALLRDLPFMGACALKGLPVMLQLHGGRLSSVAEKLGGPRIIRRMFDRATRIAVYPGPQYEELSRVIDESKLLPMVNMVPSTRLKVGEGPPRFLFLGALSREKGVGRLVETFLELAERLDRQISLDVAGQGPLEGEILRRISTSHLGRSVTLHGFLTGRRLEKLLDRCNILVLPSEREGFPLAFLECAERGMASIVTRASAVPSFFEDGTAFLGVDPKSGEELIQAMERLATHSSLRREMGRRAREAVHRCCTVEAALPRYLEAYATTRVASIGMRA